MVGTDLSEKGLSLRTITSSFLKHLQQQQILAREASASMKTVKYERRQLIFSNIFGAKWAQLDKNIQCVYSKELKKF